MHSSTSLSTWVKAKEIKWHKITCAVLQLQMLQKRNNYEGFNKTGVSQLVHNFTVFTGICLLSLMCAFPPMLTAIRKPIKSQCQELHLWGRSNATPPLHNTAAKNFRKTMACTHRTDMGEIFSKYLLPGDTAIALAAIILHTAISI